MLLRGKLFGPRPFPNELSGLARPGELLLLPRCPQCLTNVIEVKGPNVAALRK